MTLLLYVSLNGDLLLYLIHRRFVSLAPLLSATSSHHSTAAGTTGGLLMQYIGTSYTTGRTQYHNISRTGRSV